MYKKKYPAVKIIHRVNDSDKPRGNINILDPIIFETFKIDDLVICFEKVLCYFAKVHCYFEKEQCYFEKV